LDLWQQSRSTRGHADEDTFDFVAAGLERVLSGYPER